MIKIFDFWFVSDWLQILVAAGVVWAVTCIVLRLHAILLATGGANLTSRGLSAHGLQRNVELLLLLTLLGISWRSQLDWPWIAMTACLGGLLSLRAPRFYEHGVLAGTRFIHWSRVVGYRWSTGQESSLLTLLAAGSLPLKIRVAKDNVAVLQDVIAGVIRPEPMPPRRQVLLWTTRVLVISGLAASVAWLFQVLNRG